MNNYGNHDVRRYRLPDDGVGAIDDASRPYKSDWVALGKSEHTKHIKAPMPEVTADSAIETLRDALENGQGNKVENWYKLGCAYRRKGDRGNACLFLQKAVNYGHTDAKDELDELNGIKNAAIAVNVKEQKPHLSGVSEMIVVRPVKYFRVHEIVLRNGLHEYLLLVDVGNRKGLQPASSALKGCPAGTKVDVYTTRDAAYQVGMALKRAAAVGRLS